MNWLRDLPIRRKLTLAILLTCSAALLLACGVLAAYQFVNFRGGMVRGTTVLADVLAKNTQAALAFQDENAAQETLQALQVKSSVASACLYDEKGNLFAQYTRAGKKIDFPVRPSGDGYRFERGSLIVFHPVFLNEKRIGTIYIQTGLEEMYGQLNVFLGIAAVVLTGSVFVALALSSRFQRPISRPILILAETLKRIAEDKDYTVRVPAQGRDETGQLTGAFNQLLASIEDRDKALLAANESLRQEIAERKGAEERVQSQLTRLELLHRTTRAISERQDLQSIFQVVVRTLEEDLPLDFGCVCLYEQGSKTLTVTSVGIRSEALALELALTKSSSVDIDKNGLSRCVRGELVYEPDISNSKFPFPQRLAGGGLRSLVAAPLLVESRVFGVLITARRQPNGFSSGECEFLRQMSEHVALAAHQTQLYEALHQAYDDLRQTQQAVMQQERLRALGQMASGIAHDINNAISPIALYTESLLEAEPGLSARTRDYLGTIQHAIDDVAQTVSRMKEFYRQREPQLVLLPVQLNRLMQQVIDLSRARWSDMPQQRGHFIKMETELAAELPAILGVESEIREALVNLVFNAVDAMPEGGTLTLRTKISEPGKSGTADPAPRQVHVEVSDTGMGMDEDTRRRCFEPFFTTKGERGTGLGLAMVHGIVRRHNAEIEIDSVIGKGTTIRLVFSVPETPAGESSPSSSGFTMPSRLRLLITDDDPLIIKSLRDTLEMDGHVIVTANGGREGIEAFRKAWEAQEPFSAIITDLGMPYVDGRQVAAAIKGISPLTPVILLTGWGQRLAAEGDIPPHVDRVLNKPPKLRELREALAECLARTKA
ncbi:MAG: CHASE sensor domain-containing protein [Methylacidiphilales bacterium]|nr:CHASE sensor domain-containing protein [Candidatus Methylacidiphilales bacterium]